jgi:tRNA dimethylallyltransferase
MIERHKTLIVIAGPTAAGKTAAAILLAKHFKTVVVSADSRQFYREMSIGTAKPDAAELAAVKHYFIDNLSVAEKYTAGDYEQDCLALLEQLFQQHDYVVMAGGSGLFIRAVCEGFDEFPPTLPGIRERLNKEYEEKGIDYLQQKLHAADPAYFKQVDLNNAQRIIRALEVFESCGKPYSSFRVSGINSRPFNIAKFGLQLSRDVLYHQINQRVDLMVKHGLEAEVRSLVPFRHLNALATVGYSEFFDYFDGKISFDEAIALIKQNTRRFAKRQLTWFNRDKEITWLQADDVDLPGRIVSKICLTNA